MPPEENASAREWDLHDYLDLVLRRKYVIIAVFVLTFLATLAYQLTRTPIYGSYSSFIIDQSASTSGIGAERSMSYYYWQQQNKPVEYYQAIVGSAVFHEKPRCRRWPDSIPPACSAAASSNRTSNARRRCRRCWRSGR